MKQKLGKRNHSEMASYTNNMDLLPDEVVAMIGQWVGGFGIHHFLRLQQTSRRIKKILTQPPVIAAIIRDRGGDGIVAGVQTLQQLDLYECMDRAGLFQENRIGFGYASVEILSAEDGEIENNVKGSSERMESVRGLFNKFAPELEVILDAHCGTLAPHGVAPQFSRLRGEVVRDEILLNYDNVDRIIVNAWGRRVVAAASLSDHRYGDLAREGNGWVEISFRLGGLELPERPSYYEGLWVV